MTDEKSFQEMVYAHILKEYGAEALRRVYLFEVERAELPEIAEGLTECYERVIRKTGKE
ncbi:MAG: hypothetical protein QM689_04325 [Oscillospiraceae bacterium]